MKKIIFTVIFALALTACGQTGKLVLPNNTPDATTHP